MYPIPDCLSAAHYALKVRGQLYLISDLLDRADELLQDDNLRDTVDDDLPHDEVGEAKAKIAARIDDVEQAIAEYYQER
jgi:hypothetical protein